MEYAAQVAEERKLTLQILQKEMENEAEDFEEFTGKKVKVPNAKQIAVKLERQHGPVRVAAVSVPVPKEAKVLVAKYLKEERDLTKKFKAEIKSSKVEFKKNLRELRSEVKKKPGTDPTLLYERLEQIKIEYRDKLKELAMTSSRAFDSLKREYQGKDDFFEEALRRHLGIRSYLRTAGKLVIMALIMSLLVVTVHVSAGLVFGSVFGKAISLGATSGNS